MYCFKNGRKVAEAHGSGGQYSVKIIRGVGSGQYGEIESRHEIYDENDSIQAVVEQFLTTGRWPRGMDQSQDDHDASKVYGDILGDAIGSGPADEYFY